MLPFIVYRINTMRNKPESVELSNRIIDALGGNKHFVRRYNLSCATVSGWRTSGLPYPWSLYIKLRYKKPLQEAGIL